MENPITLQEQRKVWTIHQSVNGITYYYNRSTKKSQYEMPQCFKITQQDLDHPDWKEYRTAEGRKFYYNALTRKSCWHMPAEVKEWRMKIQEQKRIQKEEKGEEKEEEKLSDQQIIKRKFLALLKSKPITINTKWDSCIQICEDDERWGLLRMGQKKKYFNDYIGELKKKNDQQKKAKVQANRVQFMKMLKENKKLTSDCKMHKVQFDFITDPRWRMLDGMDKQNAFQDYMDQLMVKEKEESKKSRERNIQNLKILLEELDIKHNTKWEDFKNIFKNYECYKNLHPLDRINTFTSYIIEAEKKFQEQEIRQKRLKQRTNRINFRKLIQDKLFSGAITYKTKWRQFCKQCRNQQDLLLMMDSSQHGTSPHQIFQVFMYTIRQNHKTFKSQIKAHFKNNNFKMNQETTYQQFYQRLKDLPLYSQTKAMLQEYFYHYFQQKIKSKHNAKIQKQKEKEKQKLNAIKKAQKKQKKAIFKIFKQIREQTKTKYNISEHISFIEESLKDQNITVSHENIFKYYLAYLQTEGDQNRKSSRSSSSQKPAQKTEKKKKKKKDKQHKDGEKSGQTVPKSIAIPAQLKSKGHNNNDMDLEEQGQIKDDDVDEIKLTIPLPNVVEPKQSRRSRSSSSSKSKSKEKQKKKKKHKKKKAKSKLSSSDSD